jgi:hypothetical protein
MIDLELLHTSLVKLQRLRISIGVSALVVALLGGYVISERASAYGALIAALQQQHTAVAKKHRQRAQNIDAAKHALQQQGIVQMQQQRMIQVLRAIGHTATTTSYYTKARTEGDRWRLYGRAGNQSEVFLLIAQLRGLLPDNAVTLVEISAEAAAERQASAVTFEIATRPAIG